MFNPIEGRNYIRTNERLEIKRKQNKGAEVKIKQGVFVEINNSQEVELDSNLTKKRIEKLKQLIKEGKYPIDHRKLAEKVLKFLLNGE